MPLWALSIGNWFKDKLVLLLIIGAGCVMIYIAGAKAYDKIGELAQAKQNIETLAQANTDLQTDMKNLKETQANTLEALKSLNDYVATIDKLAKARSQATNKKIDEINGNAQLTPEQKDQETSRVYAQSLRSTYCIYQPKSCQPKPETKP